MTACAEDYEDYRDCVPLFSLTSNWI